jgi:hypothetical protein
VPQTAKETFIARHNIAPFFSATYAVLFFISLYEKEYLFVFYGKKSDSYFRSIPIHNDYKLGRVHVKLQHFDDKRAVYKAKVNNV